MKDYCSRARAALNLILLLSLLQVWVLFSLPNSPESIDRDVANLVASLSPYAFPYASPAIPTPDHTLDKLVAAIKANAYEDNENLTLGSLTIRTIENSHQMFYDALKVAPHSDEIAIIDIDKNANAAANDLDHIHELIKRSGLPQTATVRELKHHYSGELEVPILKQSMEPKDATPVLALATDFPLAMLFVLLDSMCGLLRKVKNERKGIAPLDCIFFYRSWTAIPLGLAWLLLPFVCMADEMPTIYQNAITTQAIFVQRIIFWTIPFLVGFCIHRAWLARQLYLAVGPSEKRDGSNEEDDDGEDEDESG
jgi:hypothetical protein